MKTAVTDPLGAGWVIGMFSQLPTQYSCAARVEKYGWEKFSHSPNPKLWLYICNADCTSEKKIYLRDIITKKKIP